MESSKLRPDSDLGKINLAIMMYGMAIWAIGKKAVSTTWVSYSIILRLLHSVCLFCNSFFFKKKTQLDGDHNLKISLKLIVLGDQQ